MFYDIKNKVLTTYDVFVKEVRFQNEKGEEEQGEDTYFLNACDDDTLRELGFARVVKEKEPNFNELNEALQELAELDTQENVYRISYQVISKPLCELKEFKKAEIDAKRDAMIESGVTYKGKVFQSAEKDRNLLTSSVSLFSATGQLPQNFVWIAKDNTAVPFSLEDLIALGALMAQTINENTLKARTLKDRIESATTKEELDLVCWETE